MIAKRRRKVECESQLKGKFCARRQFMLLSFCPFSFSTSLCLCLCAIAVKECRGPKDLGDAGSEASQEKPKKATEDTLKSALHGLPFSMSYVSQNPFADCMRCSNCVQTSSDICLLFLLFCFSFSCFQGDKVNLANETHWAKCRAKCIWHAICWWLLLFFPSLPFLVRVQSRQSPAE